MTEVLIQNKKKDFDKDIMKWIKNFSNMKIREKLSIKEILNYENISLWWFFQFSFYYLIKEAYTKNFKTIRRRYTRPHLISLAKYYILTKFLIRFFCGKLISLLYRNSNNSKILCISYPMNWRQTANPLSKKPKDDIMLGSVISKLQEQNFNIIGLEQDSKLKNLFEKTLYTGGLWRPVETYLTFDSIKRAFKASKKFEKKWNELKREQNFINSLKYNGFSLFNLLENYFEEFFRLSTFQEILYIESIKRAIEMEKSDLVLITCEYCLLGRAAVIGGKLKDIPTLAIQHGVIHPLHPGYVYTKNETSDEIAPKYCPLPDKTVVYGQYHKDILTKLSAYPENSVVVTGQPRYDILYYADKIYSKEKFLKKYKINPNYKIVLWTTQCHGLSYEENIKNFKTIFETMQNLKNTMLIIKQHPGEGKKYTKMIKDNLSNYKINAIITPKDSDTYEQLFICDLMITKHSTTTMEAIALNKPVIILNLSGEPDPVEYVKEGVALGVYDEKDLNSAIENLLKDDSELAKNRKNFIEKYLYKIDGKAAERVINLIIHMIEESKKEKT